MSNNTTFPPADPAARIFFDPRAPHFKHLIARPFVFQMSFRGTKEGFEAAQEAERERLVNVVAQAAGDGDSPYGRWIQAKLEIGRFTKELLDLRDELKQTEQALAAYQKAVELAPGDKGARAALEGLRAHLDEPR